MARHLAGALLARREEPPPRTLVNYQVLSAQRLRKSRRRSPARVFHRGIIIRAARENNVRAIHILEAQLLAIRRFSPAARTGFPRRVTPTRGDVSHVRLLLLIAARGFMRNPNIVVTSERAIAHPVSRQRRANSQVCNFSLGASGFGRLASRTMETRRLSHRESCRAFCNRIAWTFREASAGEHV